jgi:lipopolysaccharide exporter
MILRNVDTWMLGGLISPTAVTMYNPAIRVANIIEVPTTSLSSILFPKLLSRYTKEGDVVAKELYEKSVGALFAVLLPAVLFVIIFANQIVFFIAGEGFEETVGILRVAMITGLIIPFNRQVGIMLTAIGKARIGFFFVLRNATMNVILCYFCVTYFGTIGAAYAMLGTYIMSFTFNQFYIAKNFKIQLINVFKYSIFCYKQLFSRAVSLTRG